VIRRAWGGKRRRGNVGEDIRGEGRQDEDPTGGKETHDADLDQWPALKSGGSVREG